MGDEKAKKVALITGSTKGIGAACARALAEAGFNLALHYRSNEEEALAIKEELPGSKVFRYDLSQEKACQELVKEVKSVYGRIDVLVNNAGMAKDQILAFAKPEDFDNILAVNLKPVFLLSKFCSKLMMRQKSGTIINITSVVGHSGNPGQGMYAASKSAITGFTKSIAQELAPLGIRCNCVAPGFISTQMTAALPEKAATEILNRIPMQRMGETKEVAAAVAFLASDQASYITASTIHVNGGMLAN